MSDGALVRRLVRCGAGLTLAVTLTGCSLLSGGSAQPAPAGSSAPTPTVPGPSSSLTSPGGAVSSASATQIVPTVSVTVPTFPSASTPPPTRTDPGLDVGRMRLRGRSSSASWDVAIPLFSGAPVAGEANRRVRAAAQDLITQVRREAKGDHGVRRTLTGNGTVGANDGRTVQVVIDFVDLLAGTAHPALYVATTVIDVGRARPVLLSQVVQNPPEGLRFLRTEVVRAARRKGDGVDRAGLAPKLANFANWQTDAKGMTLHFNDYQLGGYGLRTYTVPWKRARLVLSAYGEKLLLP